jgi:parallel beta-helix repeat protein
MQRRDLSKVLIGAAAASAVIAIPAQGQTCSTPCYPQTAIELAAGVTPANTAYLPGDVRRYGADSTGSTDSTSALAAAITTGYSLYFCDGTFLTSGNLTPKSGTTWWGTGILKSSSTSNVLVVVNGISHFVFSIDTDMSASTASYKFFLSIDNATHVVVENGYHVHGGVAIGQSAASSYFKIRGNTFTGTSLNSNSGVGAISVGGGASCQDFEIIDNEICNPSGAGIAVFNGSASGVISGNRCNYAVGSGIYIDSAAYLVIQGNVCSYNQQSGIGLNAHSPSSTGYPMACAVSGNICYQNTADGIDYNLGGAPAQQHPSFSAITGNVLANNGSAGNGVPANGGTGIYMVNVDEATVVGNAVTGNAQPGIYLNSAYYCTVTGNGLTANGAGLTNGSSAGIYVSGSYNAITGNTSTNNDGSVNQSWGINEVAGNYNCLVGNY